MATHNIITIPASLRGRVMRRAWEIFRANYGYPGVPFRSIGRHCFTAALKAAWNEAREIIRLAAYGVDKLNAAISDASQPRHQVGLSTTHGERAEVMLERMRQLSLFRTARDFAVSL